LKRAKYLVFNIYDATLKMIAVAKVAANIVIHICSSIAWQAGARSVSQPPAPGVCTENSDSNVLVMQAADQGMRYDASGALNRARDGRVLV
jgi:hypothetical protein